MLNKLRSIFKHHAEQIARKVSEKEITEKDLEDILWNLELALLESNVSLEVVEVLIKSIKEAVVGKKLSKNQVDKAIKKALEGIISEMLLEGNFYEALEDNIPRVVLVIGLNGSGKTTTLAKLGYYLKSNNHSIVFAAGDTYRAAAIEQLCEHADNLGVKCIKSSYGSDSASVIYDAIKHAQSHEVEFVLADTAGRVHTNKNLIEELKKVKRVSDADLVLLVIDSTTGSDAIEQAKMFEEVGFDGYVITKMDVDEKGGTLINISYAVKKPIFFIGTGQKYEDLKPFKKEEIVKALVDW